MNKNCPKQYKWKQCTKCGRILLANYSNFYKNSGGKYGLEGQCRDCKNKNRKKVTADSKLCSVEGCNNKHKGLGYCEKHYVQYKKYGYILKKTNKDPNVITLYESEGYADIKLYDKHNNEIARTQIDIEDVEKVKSYKWCISNYGYVISNRRSKPQIQLHRFLMDCPSNMVVDHIDHNPLNNRKSNLRIVTQHQNAMNRSKPNRKCSSKYKNVSFIKSRKKWRVQISINNKTKHIGDYESEEEASIEADKAMIYYHHQYCNLNHNAENYIEYILELGLNPIDFNINNDSE